MSSSISKKGSSSKKNIKSYTLKLIQEKKIQEGLENLLAIAHPTAQELLNQHWTDQTLDRFHPSNIKAYKIVNEKNVLHVREGIILYLPSRIRRIIAEWVGRTLRSQYEKRNCFYHVREALLTLDMTEKLRQLIPKVSKTIILLHGVYYKWQELKNTIRMIKYLWLNKGIDIWSISYTALVRPQLRNFIFPYSADDHQAIKYEITRNKIALQLKIPLTKQPLSSKDWKWVETSITIPKKVQLLINDAKKINPSKPELRFQTLKGGLITPVLQFSWEYNKIKINLSTNPKKRVLAVDLGLVNLATSVVCEDGSQISKPFFYKRNTQDIVKIERIYKLIQTLQSKINRLPINAPKQTRRNNEFVKLQLKLKNKRKQETYLLIKHLLSLAIRFRCSTIVLEDLRSYEPSIDSPKWSRRLSNWLRGSLWELLESKVKNYGFNLKRVNPKYTSSYCPRCGSKGHKVSSHTSTKENKFGRSFYCSNCSFRADRDYIGALNVYRVFACLRTRLKDKKKRYQLAYARVVLYTKTSIDSIVHQSIMPTSPAQWVDSSS